MTSKEKKSPLWQIHICPECGRKAEVYAVGKIIQEAPCTRCQAKKLGHIKDE